jgi:hypothetical protein
MLFIVASFVQIGEGRAILFIGLNKITFTLVPGNPRALLK